MLHLKKGSCGSNPQHLTKFGSFWGSIWKMPIVFKIWQRTITYGVQIHRGLMWCSSVSLCQIPLYLKKNGQIMDNEQFLYLGWTKVMWLWANFQLQWPTTNPKHLENFKQTGINCHNKLCNNQIILNVFDEWFIVTLHDFSSVCLVIWL